MTVSRIPLHVIRLPGLRPESPGNYLASLGLLRLLARQWPSVRIAWRDGVLHVVGGPANLDELLDYLCNVADNGIWTPYERGWTQKQKNATQSKSGKPLAVWQAQADEEEVELFNAHAVPHARVSFNPLLGSGGNAGRRAFSDGWEKAVKALQGHPSNNKRQELAAFLNGEALTWLLEKLNAASWFSDANKLYNSGQGPYREGLCSPWAMALACEGLPFFAGAPSRRLGVRGRVHGAFPFVTRAAAPTAEGEAGRDVGELWAPLWERPMTLPEVRALFARGRAEIGGRGASTPSAFAAAIVRRGVDAGVVRFVRFSLGRTTSANTFEPRWEGEYAVTRSQRADVLATAVAMERLVALIDRMPPDRKKGNRWQFVGLRGPIEKAMLRVAQAPDDPEAARALLDSVVASLDRVDRNRSFREKRINWEPLPLDYLRKLLGTEAPGIEVRLALALVSSFPSERPFTLYRFGVQWQYGKFVHTADPPARWVWGPGSLSRVLSAVLLRRCLDWEADAKNEKDRKDREDPTRRGIPTSLSCVRAWLAGRVDENLLSRWLSRLALFDWRDRRAIPAPLRALSSYDEDGSEIDAGLALFGLFQPLFDLRRVKPLRGGREDDLLDPKTGARTPGTARALANLLRAGRVEAAVHLARARYAMAGAPLAKTEVPWSFYDADRLLAAVMFPVADVERSVLVERWLRPRRAVAMSSA